MELSAALARDLALLSDAIDDGAADGARVDLGASLTRTVQAARAAVESYVGLTVTTGPDASDLRFTVLHDGASSADVRASLRVPFRTGSADASSPAVVFYASAPGAFVDLAADIAWLTGRETVELALDDHLHRLDDADGAGTVAARSAIDQAIGVLLARGRTPEQARADLERRAADDGHDLERAAAETIADVVPGPGEGGLDDRPDEQDTS